MTASSTERFVQPAIQSNSSRTYQHSRSGRGIGRWLSTPRNVPPSTFQGNAIPSRLHTIYTATPWKKSQVVNTSESPSARTYLGVNTSTQPRPKPHDQLDFSGGISEIDRRASEAGHLQLLCVQYWNMHRLCGIPTNNN